MAENRKKKIVVLHIGTDKTGSTAIQEFAFGNSDYLSARGFGVVPSIFPHHGPICDELLEGKTELLEKAVEFIENADFDCALLTFEGFYHLTGESLDLLIRSLSGFELHVVLYIRRRSDMIRSGFAQNMKLNRDVDLVHVSRFFSPFHVADFPSLGYLEIVRRWQSSLAENASSYKFDLRVYGRSSLRGGNILNDFFYAVGQFDHERSGAGISERFTNSDVNPSLSPAAQTVMVLVALLGLDERRRRLIRDVIMNNDERSESSQSLIPDDLADYFDHYREQEDRILAQEFFQREVLFTDPPKYIFLSPSYASVMKIITGIYRDRDSLDFLDPLPVASGVAVRNWSEIIDFESDDPARLLHDAIMLIDAGETVLARAVLEKIVEIRPNQPRANYELAKMLKSDGRIGESEVCMGKARKFASGNPSWLVDLE